MEIKSDRTMTFGKDLSKGTLTKFQDVFKIPAGFMHVVPRRFSISNDGSMVTVGSQQDSSLRVWPSRRRACESHPSRQLANVFVGAN